MGGRDDRRNQSGGGDSAGDEYRPDRGGDRYGGGPERGDGDRYASQRDEHGQQGGRDGGYRQGSDGGYQQGGPGGGYQQGGRGGGYQEGGRGGGYQQGGHGGGHGPGGGRPAQGPGGYGNGPYLDTDVLGKRIGAHIIDNLLIGVLAIVLVIAIAVVGVATGPTTSAADTAVGGLAIIVGVVGVLFYLFLLEGYWDGQTVGKRAVNIRVVNEDGSEIGYAESVIRNLIEIFEGIFYYIPAVIIIAASDRDQRLGDHAASTLVIDDDPNPRPPQQGHQQPPAQGRQNTGEGPQYQHPPADRNRQSRQSGDRSR